MTNQLTFNFSSNNTKKQFVYDYYNIKNKHYKEKTINKIYKGFLQHIQGYYNFEKARQITNIGELDINSIMYGVYTRLFNSRIKAIWILKNSMFWVELYEWMEKYDFLKQELNKYYYISKIYYLNFSNDKELIIEEIKKLSLLESNLF